MSGARGGDIGCFCAHVDEAMEIDGNDVARGG